MAKIAVLEGVSPALRRVVTQLDGRDFCVVEYSQAAMSELNHSTMPDMYILEINAHGNGDLSLIQRIRTCSNYVGILTLIPSKVDRLNIFQAGADHCIHTPYVIEELLAIIKNMSRRLRMY